MELQSVNKQKQYVLFSGNVMKSVSFVATGTVVKLLCNSKLEKLLCCPKNFGKNFFVCLDFSNYPSQFSFQISFFRAKKKEEN